MGEPLFQESSVVHFRRASFALGNRNNRPGIRRTRETCWRNQQKGTLCSPELQVGLATRHLMTSTNQLALQEHMLLNEMLLISSDAIHTGNGLGYAYIWIDVPCVTQDLPVEVELQINTMQHILLSSGLTPFAAVGDS